jgi:hypothetical protein
MDLAYLPRVPERSTEQWVRSLDGLSIAFVTSIMPKSGSKRCRAGGLSIEGTRKEFSVAVQAVTPDGVSGQFDRIFFYVKAQHTKDAAAPLGLHLSTSGYGASLQNGLNEQGIARAVGASLGQSRSAEGGDEMFAPSIISVTLTR